MHLLALALWGLLIDNVNIKNQVFFAYYYALFILILIANVGGMIPYSLTVTSFLLITFFLSLTTFLGITILGCLYNGKNFFCIFLPGGIPLIITILLIVIELVSYSAKVLSLSIRIFANMMSGHTLLKILIAFV